MTTTRFPSLGTLRALAASRRRGRLVGGSWSTITDRDLDRIGSDLLVLSQTDPALRLPSASPAPTRVTPPVDLDVRRASKAAPAAVAGTHARAS